jgi:hypothetical protein
MIIPEHTSLSDLSFDPEMQEALHGLSEIKRLSIIGPTIGLSHAQVSDLALQAAYMEEALGYGMHGFFKKTWKKVRKATHKIRYKALSVLRKVAPVLSFIPVIGIPLAVAYAAIEAQQIYQGKRQAKDQFKKAYKIAEASWAKEESQLTKEEKEAQAFFKRVKAEIELKKKQQTTQINEEELAAQVLIAKIKSEFGPQAKHIIEAAEQGREITVPTSKGDIPLPPPPQLSPDEFPPGITAATGDDLPAGKSSSSSATSAASSESGSSIGLLVGGGVAVGGLIILMMANKKKRKKR